MQRSQIYTIPGRPPSDLYDSPGTPGSPGITFTARSAELYVPEYEECPESAPENNTHQQHDTSSVSDMEGSGERQPLMPKRHVLVVPSDRFYLVYLIFYLLGVGALLPWNFFSNARQYFVFKLRSNTSVSEHDWVDDPATYNHLQAMFVPYLSMAAMIPNVLFMFLNTAVTRIMDLRIRIILATTAMISMFLLTIILTKLDTDKWRYEFFSLTIVSIVIMNAGSAVLQGGVFGLSSSFPKEYTQSVMGGMGMGGVIAAAANILAIWLSKGPLDSGFGYFLTAELVIIGALVGYLCLPCLVFARHHIEDRPTYTNVNTDSTEEVMVRSQRSSLWKVFKQIKGPALSVFMIFMTTLACYPAINSRIFSVGDKDANPSIWADKYFIPVTCFLLFNVGDLVGRTLAGIFQWPHEKSPILPLLAVLRVVFIPIFLMCNVLPRKHMPLVFNEDYVPIITMNFFAFSNGYLSTLCMMYGPRLVDLDDMETAGSMMSFFLSLGLGSGSAISFLLASFV